MVEEEPDPGTCNALHIHLVEYACEELWSMADDSEDEQTDTYEEQAEQLMRAGGTPANKDLLSWLRNRIPSEVHQKVLQEATRVDWPFMPTTSATDSNAAATDSNATPRVAEPMSAHPQWKQLQDVIREGMRALQGRGKTRRIPTDQRRVCDQTVAALVEEAGRLEYNDALLVIAQRLQMQVDEVVHEWNFEIDWQQEWGERTGKSTTPSAASSVRPSQ